MPFCKCTVPENILAHPRIESLEIPRGLEAPPTPIPKLLKKSMNFKLNCNFQRGGKNVNQKGKLL